MEFKKLSAVEKIEKPSDTANVLIEENGVVKKAPKTAVGGIEADMIIHVTESEEELTATIVSGSYDNVNQKLENGIPILIQAFGSVPSDPSAKFMLAPLLVKREIYDDGTNRVVLHLFFVDMGLVIFPDNTVILD